MHYLGINTMKNFKKIALAASVSSLMLGASAAQAHVAYNSHAAASTNVSAGGGQTWSDGGSYAYTGNLPTHWVANLHGVGSSVEVSDHDAFNHQGVTVDLQSANNKWNPAHSWGAALGYGLINIMGHSDVAVTINATDDDGSDFTPGFTLWKNWDASAASNKHGPWNADPANPDTRGSNELLYLDHASTSTAGGTASLTTILAPGEYSLWIGGNATNANGGNTSGLDQSYQLAISTSAVPLPAAAWLFGGALLSLFGANRCKKVVPA